MYRNNQIVSKFGFTFRHKRPRTHIPDLKKLAVHRLFSDCPVSPPVHHWPWTRGYRRRPEAWVILPAYLPLKSQFSRCLPPVFWYDIYHSNQPESQAFLSFFVVFGNRSAQKENRAVQCCTALFFVKYALRSPAKSSLHRTSAFPIRLSNLYRIWSA